MTALGIPAKSNSSRIVAALAQTPLPCKEDVVMGEFSNETPLLRFEKVTVLPPTPLHTEEELKELFRDALGE